MICRIFSFKSHDGWLLRIESDPAPGPVFLERTIKAIAPAGAGQKPPLPLPPASESGSWAGKPHADLCDAVDHQTVDAVYRRILEKSQSGEVALFGEYLTAVLLGPNLALLEALPPPVDLRLVFDDQSLQRLPWEMMYGPQENPAAGPSAPLSARPDERISINREVPLARERRRARSPAAKDGCACCLWRSRRSTTCCGRERSPWVCCGICACPPMRSFGKLCERGH